MPSKANRQALKVALIYVSVAAAWILFSDELLKLLIHNPQLRAEASIFKGLVFVLTTGALLYLVVRNLLAKWAEAAEASRRSQERYALVQQAVDDGLWDWNILTDEDVFSPRWKQIVGYQDHELPNLQSAFLELLHPDDREFVQRATQAHLENGERYALEFRLRHKDGSWRSVYSRGEAVRDSAGRPARMVGAITDITDTKRSEVKLREGEEKFSKIFASSPMPITLSTMIEGRYLDVNDAFLGMVQRSRDEVIGRTALEVGVWADPARRASVIEQIKQTGWVRNIEVAIRTPAGKVGHILWSAEAVVIGGESCLLGTSLDFTELKLAQQKQLESEEHMNVQVSALEAADNAIVITDQRGRIEWVNPAFCKLTGYAAEETIGNNPRVLKSGQHPPAFYANIWSTVLTGNVWHGEIVNRRKDGRLYTEEMTVTPVRGADGHIAHFVAIKQDVTEQRDLERRMQQSQKMEAIGTLAGGIAHDFNNILAAMMGFTYLLQQDTQGNALAQEYTEEILKSASRAKDLVQQILTFSRQREQKPQVIRLDQVVKEAIKFLRASLPAQIKIQMNLDPKAPLVLADPTQIYQVTVNLATNALHAMEGRPGLLTVNLDYFTPDEKFMQSHPEFRPFNYTRLTVADTGDGMDPKTLGRIFEPFYTTKAVGKGTGLGLAVVHGIVQAHNGIITVDSQVGQGSTFHVYFPGRASAPAPALVADGQAPEGSGQKILLLDDEPAITSSLQQLLVRLNYQVTTSNSAKEVLNWCRDESKRFDVVITDLTMPEMNGLEMTRQLQTLRPGTPVILASGFTSDLTNDSLKAAGVSALLNKPISRTALAETLQRTLAGQNAHAQPK